MEKAGLIDYSTVMLSPILIMEKAGLIDYSTVMLSPILIMEKAALISHTRRGTMVWAVCPSQNINFIGSKESHETGGRSRQGRRSMESCLVMNRRCSGHKQRQIYWTIKIMARLVFPRSITPRLFATIKGKCFFSKPNWNGPNKQG